MARIVLLDASASTWTAVSAVAAEHELVRGRSGEDQPQADLLVLDLAGPQPVSPDLAAGVQARAGVLLLIDRRARVAEALAGSPRVEVLRRPFDLFELRAKIDALTSRLTSSSPDPFLEQRASSVYASRSGPAEPGESLLRWMESPLVPSPAAATLAAARHLRGTAWIVGESGSGRDRVAAALAMTWDSGRDPVSWFPGQPFLEAVTAIDDPDRVLLVHEIDARPTCEQRDFESFTHRHPDLRIVVTSDDEPGDAVLAGTLLRSLYHGLAGLALRLPPLRERRRDIPSLCEDAASRISSLAFSGARVRFTDEASRTLQAYDWPGNLDELTAVVTRSVVARAAPEATTLVIEAADLLFAPPLSSAAGATGSTLVENTQRPLPGPARRGVVVPLAGAVRVAGADEAERDTALSAPIQDEGVSVEPLLAAFAHDIRNPMSTIQAYTSIAASTAEEGSSELARLAVEACEMVGDHLALLQRYSELAPTGRSRFDLLEMVGEALDETGEDAGVSLEVRRPLWVRADRELLRFCADVVFAECRARRPALAAKAPSTDAAPRDATLELDADGTALEIRIPIGDAAVDRLGKWVEGASLPWRLALARNAARRAGGDLEIETDREAVRLRWRAPLAEEGSDGEQARSADRRRRSRSS